ncbi:hypothetical protein AVEN_182334-1 [Araneus ventricosus]|uniref:Uncharacterized protein n=1 Tax=Araneus ventricosus TaxID=182803 RepID=A0A4Y2KBD9_ARAVE|nr:hypothetical protein AVEN_182334-1 [Araneus ventricosus]
MELFFPRESRVCRYERKKVHSDISGLTLAPLKPGVFGRKRHELDLPNLGGHLPHNLILFYNFPLRRTEMGCGWIG